MHAVVGLAAIVILIVAVTAFTLLGVIAAITLAMGSHGANVTDSISGWDDAPYANIWYACDDLPASPCL